ncbi:MAG: 3-dehydroquinate synthase [Anaerolineales bacterium]|nr:3-dehydroquinate synthase [Anaerolineales bacterium]
MKPTIFIYGPSGAGKTTIGRKLAEKLALPHVDIDSVIEAIAGKPIPAIFGQDGEPAFRAFEKKCIQEAANGEPAVISLGGGALLDESIRSWVVSRGQVIFLSASVDTLEERLSADYERPLVKNDSISQLIDKRKDHYGSFTNVVDTTNLGEDKVVSEIQKIVGYYFVQGMGDPYDVLIQSGGINAISSFLESHGLSGPFTILTDKNIAKHHLKPLMDTLTFSGFDCHSLIIPAGEDQKTLKTMETIWNGLLTSGMERKGMLIALGGGVINDMGGFAAATFMRGIRWTTIPTTLLAMVDASVGGKTGANLSSGKNLIGAFNPPQFVISDANTLSTLDVSEIRSGMAEVIKHGVISDGTLLEICAKDLETIRKDWDPLIRRAMGVKIDVIEQDPYEGNLREILNYGHTVGHGIELLTGYRVRHGEAVGIGMVVEAQLAEMIGIASPGLSKKIKDILKVQGLPVTIPEDIHPTVLVNAMKKDKKRKKGKIRFALPLEIGKVKPGVEIENLEELMTRIKEEY